MATTPTTRTEAETLLLENSDYRWSTGTAKVEQYIIAVEYLILQMPERATHGGRGGEEIQTNIKQLEKMLQAAEEYRASQTDASQGTAYLDFSEYRT